MWDNCGYWVYPKNRLGSAESILKFVTWALHLGSSKRHVKASIMLELWVKEDTEEVAWSRWGKSIWFRWSQSHHWVLCPISCVVIVALNFMISSNDLRGVGWCYSGGKWYTRKWQTYIAHKKSSKEQQPGGWERLPSIQASRDFMANYCFTSGQDAKALLYESFINRESRREKYVRERVAKWTMQWTCITHLWGYRRICNPITYIGSQHL